MSISARNSIVVQSNRLTESRYTLTVAEQRLVITLISFISPDDEDFKDYEIKLSDFQRILDIKSNTIYNNVESVLEKLGSRVINIPKGNGGYLIINWFSSAEYDPKSGCISISFDRKLKPYLLQLKAQFTRYRLFTAAQFQGSYTVRIYMFLKQYERVGFREIDLYDLRFMLDINDKKYPQFKEFKRNIINQAKKEFEKKDKDGNVKSDITFDLETIRTGRKITRLRFNIRKQKYQEQLPFDIPDDEPQTPAVQALMDHKISETLARKFEVEQGEEEVLRCVSMYEKKVQANEVKNTDGGYLLKMLEARAGQEGKAEREAREKAEARKKAELEAAEAQRKREIREEARKKAIEAFLAEYDTEGMAELVKEFEASEVFTKKVKPSPFECQFYKDHGVERGTTKSFFQTFIFDNYLNG